MPKLALLALALLAAPAFADAPKIDSTYGFDWSKDPAKAKCAKVEGALRARLEKQFACGAPEAGSASGRPVVAACKAKSGSGEWLLFATKDDCDAERETQAANGP
jgi:hypothetical protein